MIHLAGVHPSLTETKQWPCNEIASATIHPSANRKRNKRIALSGETYRRSRPNQSLPNVVSLSSSKAAASVTMIVSITGLMTIGRWTGVQLNGGAYDPGALKNPDRTDRHPLDFRIRGRQTSTRRKTPSLIFVQQIGTPVGGGLP